jgi:GNAT superfamily N-acetyltransferase
VQPAWDAYFALGRLTVGPAGSAHRGEGWFALITGEQSAELNICALTPGAGAGDVDALSALLGRDLPAVVFRSEFADPGATGRLERLGFQTAEEPEALMVCRRPAAQAAGPFVVRRAAEEELVHGVRISSEAHEVGAGMLERTLARTPADAIELWLAWEGDEPVSAVWLLQRDGVIAVRSMMTPPRHQRRGAGRAVLTTALAETWADDTRFAVLLSTPAGRRLYEATGFAVVDTITTSFRGIDQAQLEAIGQR